MNNKERNQLITYRLDQAKETISDVQLLIENARFRSAINRIYWNVLFVVGIGTGTLV